jgi:hypothetical protein
MGEIFQTSVIEMLVYKKIDVKNTRKVVETQKPTKLLHRFHQ